MPYQAGYLHLMNDFWVFFAGLAAGVALSLFLAGLAVFKVLLDQASEAYGQLTEAPPAPMPPSSPLKSAASQGRR